MSLRLVVGIAALLPGLAAAESPDRLAGCRMLMAAAERLACYDAVAGAPFQIRFEGSGSTVTAGFDVDRPRRLQLENLDAVLVVYLLNAAGEVVQNLHNGGAGRQSFLIPQPGRYRLQINATGGWRAWVE